jgi:hypothetical protein
MPPEELFTQARARIIWGESSTAVRAFLMSNGIPVSEADSKLDEFVAERNTEVRQLGIRRICLGSLIVIGAASFFLVIPERAELEAMNRLLFKGFISLAVAIGFGGIYGLYKLAEGIVYVVCPKSERSSIPDI